MRRAFGDEIVKLQGERLLENLGGRFTPLHADLTESLFVVLDEADKPGAIPSGKLNEIIGDTLSVERKGVDPYIAKRLGTLWFLGNDWPAIDTSAAGIAARFDWAWDFAESEKRNGVMEGMDVWAMRHPDGGAVIQARILDLAKSLAALDGRSIVDSNSPPLAIGKPKTQTSRSNGYMEDFKSSGEPLAFRALKRALVADESGFVASAAIDDHLKSCGFIDAKERPKGRVLGGYMRKIAPGAKSEVRRAAGKVTRGWAGVKWTKEAEGMAAANEKEAAKIAEIQAEAETLFAGGESAKGEDGE